MSKNYNREELRSLFQKTYEQDDWREIIKNYFNATDIRKKPEPLPSPSDEMKAYNLGCTTTTDGYEIFFLYYKCINHSIARRKVTLRQLAKSMASKLYTDAVLAIFDDGNNWRLSFICDLKGEKTSPKRFTYVFGDPKLYYHTPVARFLELQKRGISFANIKEAFSVEALSDDFFNKYKAQYDKFTSYITHTYFKEIKKGKYEERPLEGAHPRPELFAQFNNDGTRVRNYIKKFLGRLVFLFFLQRKGWLGCSTKVVEWGDGNQHFLQDLYEHATSKQKDDFLDSVLEPLFHECLNTERTNDVFDTKINSIGCVRIPYLNGGLFERDENDATLCRFPADYFKDLFGFFSQYNFTIDENSPDDAEIGVDPEMLSKIFESQLECNKELGAYYTPKEIVRYMCKESLIAYLANDDNEHEPLIRQLVELHECPNELSDMQCALCDKLKSVKVCDPAIGSGAFPMGILLELVQCREALNDPDADDLAELKRTILRNNIYGVDIEKGAIDIARLRFWLSLVVDSSVPQPLPNLDFKIMQGNSLLEWYQGIELDGLISKLDKVGTQKELFSKGIKGHVDNYKYQNRFDLRKEVVGYYLAHSDVKKDKLCAINQCIEEVIHATLKEQNKDTDTIPLPSGNDQFFLWHTWFNDVFEKGGFDIVIANPPYITSEDMVKIYPIERKLYAKLYPQTAKGNWDFYVVFFDFACKIMKKQGIGAFITPNKWLSIPYGAGLRNILTSRLVSITDCIEIDIFETAKVSPVISIFCAKNRDKLNIYKMKSDYTCDLPINKSKSVLKKIDNLSVTISDYSNELIKLIELNNIGDYYNLQSSATTNEAYLISSMIEDFSYKNDSFKVINTGLIRKFNSLWGESKARINKKDYLNPIIKKQSVLDMNIVRYDLSCQKKILVQGVRHLDAFLDIDGTCCAYTSVPLILQKFKEYPLEILLPIINSNVAWFFMYEAYKGLALGGGITFTPQNLSSIPIPALLINY